jgi:plasmid stability protein
VVRLLTPDNRALLAVIRDKKPQSVAELVRMSGRAQPNLTRTLAKMEAAGFISMQAIGRRKAPRVVMKNIVVEIDPYSDQDRLRVRAAEDGHSDGHSMEAEASRIPQTALKGSERPAGRNLYERIRARFAPLRGVELDLPAREPAPDPPRFD